MEWTSYDPRGASNGAATVMPSIGLSTNPWDAATLSSSYVHPSLSQQPSVSYDPATLYSTSSSPYTTYQTVLQGVPSYPSNGGLQLQQHLSPYQMQPQQFQQHQSPSQAYQQVQQVQHQYQPVQQYKQAQVLQTQQAQPPQQAQQKQQQQSQQQKQSSKRNGSTGGKTTLPKKVLSQSSQKKDSATAQKKASSSSESINQVVLPAISQRSVSSRTSATIANSRNDSSDSVTQQTGFISTSIPPSSRLQPTKATTEANSSKQSASVRSTVADRLNAAEQWTCECGVTNVPKRMLCKTCFRPRQDDVFDLDQYLIAFAEAAATGDFNMLDHICADFQIAGSDDLECAQNVRKVVQAQSITEAQYLFLYEKLMDVVLEKFSSNQAIRIVKYRQVLQIALSLPPTTDSFISARLQKDFDTRDRPRFGGLPPFERSRRPFDDRSHFPDDRSRFLEDRARDRVLLMEDRPRLRDRSLPLWRERYSEERVPPFARRHDDFLSSRPWYAREDERDRRYEEYSSNIGKRSRDWEVGHDRVRRESRGTMLTTYLPPITDSSLKGATREPASPRLTKVSQSGEWRTISVS